MIKACKWIDVCPLRGFEQQGLLGDKWRKKYCEKYFSKCKRFKMQESGTPHPDNMLPDGTLIKN